MKKNTKSRAEPDIVSGVNPIYEILRLQKRKVFKIWSVHKSESGLVPEIERIAIERKIPFIKTSREEIFRISRIEKNQGIAAEVSAYKYSSVEEILKRGEGNPKGHFILVLDNILDPQNLGSIVRTAHLMGMDGIIIPERNSASMGPASTRASAGAAEHMLVAQVTNITRTLEYLKEKGVWVIGVELGGKDLYSHVFSGSYALVVGSEGKGIRRLVKETCDDIVTIPVKSGSSGVNSYNASVASAIFIAEVARQRNFPVSEKS